MLARYRYSAAASTASSTVASRPATSASGYRRSAVWFLNHDSPRLHARLVSTIFTPSACSSMSSHTHPQNVQVAFFTTVREDMRWFRARVLFLGGAVPARRGGDGRAP